jgi:hypothetical protein
MKKPTIVDFITRVGGLILIYIIGIKLTSTLFPGYESITIYLMTAIMLVLSVIDSIRRKTKSKVTSRKRKRR